MFVFARCGLDGFLGNDDFVVVDVVQDGRSGDGAFWRGEASVSDF